MAQNKDTPPQNDQQLFDIKELQESWYTKSELKKMTDLISSPYRGTSINNTMTLAEIEDKQYNLTRIKVSNAMEESGEV